MNMKPALKTPPATPTAREIRDQVERIATSAAFRPSDRLKHFITFVTSQMLQGKGDNLKEYAVGVQVFGRESSFDPRTDPVVRVQARRLRARLERYYKEEGDKMLASSRQLLDTAGIKHTPHILVGQIAQAIVEHAQKSGCQMIYLGTRGMTPLPNMLLGSIATKVLHLAHVPVVLIH